MSTKRQLLVDAVKTRFATITVANGYTTNSGAHQFEWRMSALETTDLPAQIIRDETEDTVIADKNQGNPLRLLKIVLDLVLAESNATATEARKAIGDVIKAIAVDQTWGGLARRTLPQKDELMGDEKGQRVDGARMTFVIEYGRPMWTA